MMSEKMNKPHYCGICGVVSYPRLTKEGERCGVCDKLLPKKGEKKKRTWRMKLSEPYQCLQADHQRAIKEYPLLNSITFSVITLLLMYLAVMSILCNNPLVAFLSGFFGGLSARDAWVSYEAWRHKA